MFEKALWLFVHRYGLLGLFNEAFAAPILPSRSGLFAWVAPDSLLDKWGRLHPVDLATEGKDRLDAFLCEKFGPFGNETRLTLGSEWFALPHELSLSSQKLTPFGLVNPTLGASYSETLSWEEAKNLFGVRAVLDEQAEFGVSIISTREPLSFWDLEIEYFPVPPCTADQLNSHMWSATPHAVTDGDGTLQPSWRCSSLLQAMNLMLYLDETDDAAEIRKYQAPNCPYYFRIVGGDGRSLKSVYCPPEEPRKVSKCASRASSQMYRDRKRGKS